MRINHNIASINGQRQLAKNEGMMSKSLERLSSGLKINRAADNAAGLVISEQMRAQISGLKQAIDNTETAVSMVQTTEGALDEVNSLLTKARELTLHAMNSGVNDVTQLSADQSELDNVIQTISRISEVTQFGTKKLLDGSLNGAKNLAADISHVKVGNLANNPAITEGTVTIAMAAGSKESVQFVGGTTTDDYIFSAAVTGVNMGAASVISGVTVTLAIDDSVIAYVTTGTMGASALATELSTRAAAVGFSVTEVSGELTVQRNVIGAADFTSQLTFTRATTLSTAGTNESMQAVVQLTTGNAGTSANAAALIFGAGNTTLSGVTTTGAVTTGTIFSFNISTASGAVISGSHTVITGQTVADVMTSVQALITAITSGGNMSGATLALGAGSTSGMSFTLTRGDDTILTDFNFTMNIDYNSVATKKAHVAEVSLNGAGYETGAGGAGTETWLSGTTGFAGGVFSGSVELSSGAVVEVIIDGQAVQFRGAGGGTSMTGVADGLQTAIQALGGQYVNMGVAFVSGGNIMSGGAITGGAGGVTGATFTGGTMGANGGFVFFNSDGETFTVTLSVDEASGNNVNSTTTAIATGLGGGATLDLTTTSQAVIASGVTSVVGQSGRSVSSTTGASVVTAGADASATLTTANGVILNLEQSRVSTAGVTTMTLNAASVALGYKDFSAEFTASLSLNGGITTFDLDNGAEFQVGANAAQQVGLTIDDASTTEIGRGASDRLESLDDLLSTKKGALLNGLGVDALAVIDAAIDQITNLRGRFGAFQANTLESGLSSLRVSFENLTSAESTIRDVDFANESANFTRNQILVQASTSMLAQANQLPQNVLKLLQ
jgi:flagellin